MAHDIEPGTVSHGTLRPEDLLPTFWAYVPETRKAEILATFTYHDILEMMEAGTLDYDELAVDVDETLDYLFDVLDDLAPAGYYFGAIEGDGSDFGFWPIEEED